MLITLLSVLGLLGSSSLTSVEAAVSPAVLYQEVLIAEWSPREGDIFLVDTVENLGYLVHTNGEFLRFEVVTGQQRYVSYIGRYYHAATPNQEWVGLSKEIKGDRVTFGPTGRFIRLFKDGELSTPYGIHEYLYEERMFQSPGRYGSMGCVVVRSNIMDIIEHTYDVNGGRLEVSTQSGLKAEHYVL
jgi:hypothetical protein